MLKDTITDRLGHAFGLNTAFTVGNCMPGTHASAVLELRHADAGDFFSRPFAREDAYLVFLNLGEAFSCEAWVNGQSIGEMHPGISATRIFHLAQDISIHYQGPFHVLALYISQELLEAVTDQHRQLDIPTPPCILGGAGDDPVIRGLGHSLLSVMGERQRLCRPFVDHVLMSLSSHLLYRYGGTPYPAFLPIRGLAPWQERRAKELMLVNLQKGVSMKQLATACRLSSSAFARSFKQSMGVTPYQWFIARRVEHAIKLMSRHDLSLTKIALDAGFGDQSHFTRVFTEKMGVNPKTWRARNVQTGPATTN